MSPDLAATRALALGRPIVVVSTCGLRAELVLAAERATTHAVAFLVRHGTGFLRVALSDDDADRLDLPVMYPPGSRGAPERDCVAVDAAHGTTTGISAADRARTISLLAASTSTPRDFTRPGHVIPVRAAADTTSGGTLPTALALAGRAGLRPVVATCALVSSSVPALLAGPREAREFAARTDLALVHAGDPHTSRPLHRQAV
ncbi:3,4-dihydroxy-2-butanone-4-phosphate synthase [Amycolatopsis thermophila]|uniref:3,4-dihydroxy-2-butanone-4-phosphate synthase n=1 Tax=Amycolatopsis thermophila TaxID=206084 RepID=A0ABU0F1F6_9PSEU|nr:3,4-dihydroxy-2-butanone-4-phosphate synthase [Amycolatopsis thermophila]MDQ0381410.1 3,4-dihydroxy 2-butanone 4-phosphate synthase/GTP cyclohydrolase II [Amycolatopsis thermophila]